MTPPTLIETALRALLEGPLSTGMIAERVLGLRGNAEAAARAVFTLLGRDERFAVDGGGVWSLRAGTEAESALSRLRFAVVDVETTGGAWQGGDRITEIAIVQVEGGRIGECYETLVDPGRPIPPLIQRFTGITDAMVAVAPPFAGVSSMVAHRLHGRLFVAHNASFDWGFVSRELQAAGGETPEVPRVCTVQLGRRLHPELRSHGLDALTDHFGIRVRARHRASGDALATAELLLRFLAALEERGVSELPALLRFLRRPVRPPKKLLR